MIQAAAAKPQASTEDLKAAIGAGASRDDILLTLRNETHTSKGKAEELLKEAVANGIVVTEHVKRSGTRDAIIYKLIQGEIDTPGIGANR